MWFSRKPRETVSKEPLHLQSGLEMALGIEPPGTCRVVSDTLARYLPTSWQAVSTPDALGYGIGRAAAGDRVTILADGDVVVRAAADVRQAVLQRIPCVVLALSDDEEDLTPLALTGAVVLTPHDGVSAAHLAGEARRLAESKLVPVICVLALGAVARSRQPAESIVRPPGEELDSIRSLFFGSNDPAWIDPDRPVGLGVRDRDEKGAAARAAFFDGTASLEDRAVDGYRTDDATHLLVAYGVLGERLCGVVDALRAHSKRRIGLVRLVQLAPWPDAALSRLIGGRPACLFAPARMATPPGIHHRAAIGRILPDFDALADSATRLVEGRLPAVHVPGAYRPTGRPLPPEVERSAQQVRLAWPAADEIAPAVQSGIVTAPAAALIASGTTLAEWVGGPLADALAGAGRPVRTSRMGPHTVALSLDGSLPAPRAAQVLIQNAFEMPAATIRSLVAPDGRIVWPEGAVPAFVPENARGCRVLSVKATPHPWGQLGAGIRALVPEEEARKGVTTRVVRRLHTQGFLADEEVDAVLEVLEHSPPPEAGTPLAASTESVREAAPPRSVTSAASGDEGFLADPVRWWRAEGYLNLAGREAERPPTPFDGVAALPASTASPRPNAGPDTPLPRLIPESCSGCGHCWTLCPDAAIVTWTGSFDALLGTAFSRLEASGGSTMRLGRMRAAWASACHRLFRSDDLGQYRTLDSLLAEALDRLLVRAAPSDEQRTEILDEFERVAAFVPALGLARTDPFFTEPEAVKAGLGGPLALAIDPDACSRCSACTAACPETALEDSSLIELAREETAFCLDAPAPVVGEMAASTAAYTDRGVLRSVAGLRAPAGIRSAVRAVVGAAEIVTSRGIQPFFQRVDATRSALEKAAQDALHESVTVRDFDDLHQRLASMGQDESAARLPDLIPGDGVAPETLKQQVAARMRMQQLANRLGAGPARLVAVIADDGALPIPQRPNNPFAFPWTAASPSVAGAVAAGLFDSLAARHCRDVSSIREAELIVQGVYDEAEHASALHDLSWSDLTDEERAACPSFVVFAGALNDGLRRLLQGTLPVRIALLRSGSVDDPAAVPERRASVGHPDRLATTLIEGFGQPSAALFRLMAPTEPNFFASAVRQVADGSFDLQPSPPAPSASEPVAPVEPVPTAPSAAPVPDGSAVEQLTERLLALSGFGAGQSGSLRDLLDAESK